AGWPLVRAQHPHPRRRCAKGDPKAQRANRNRQFPNESRIPRVDFYAARAAPPVTQKRSAPDIALSPCRLVPSSPCRLPPSPPHLVILTPPRIAPPPSPSPSSCSSRRGRTCGLCL